MLRKVESYTVGYLVDREASRLKNNKALQCAVLTITDTRTKKTDESGYLIGQLLEESGLTLSKYRICHDDILAIRHMLSNWTINEEIDVIITTGGTGIAKRDCTIEAIQPLINKEITGFGELFRFLSFTEDVGTRAMLSRAIAGTISDKVVFSLPGSTKAVKFAMKRLILPELNHLIYEATKHLKVAK